MRQSMHQKLVLRIIQQVSRITSYNVCYTKLLRHDLLEQDYQGFKNDEPLLDQYLKGLENIEVNSLSRDEQFAFYVNGYNAWTIKLILGAYPGIKSIKDLGNIFKTPCVITSYSIHYTKLYELRR